MEELHNTINNRIKSNSQIFKDMLELFKHDAEPSKSDPEINESITLNYNNQELDILFSVKYTGEPHRLQIEKGYYSVKIKCVMEDTGILTDIKPEFYELSEALFLDKDPVVTQDYPTKSVRISRDLTADEFKTAFLN